MCRHQGQLGHRLAEGSFQRYAFCNPHSRQQTALRLIGIPSMRVYVQRVFDDFSTERASVAGAHFAIGRDKDCQLRPLAGW
jgi:hypothetical protein